MITPREFTVEKIRYTAGWVKLFFFFATGFVIVGALMAFWEFWDEPRQLIVPLLLAGIGLLLFLLLIYVFDILCALGYLQGIAIEKREKDYD